MLSKKRLLYTLFIVYLGYVWYLLVNNKLHVTEKASHPVRPIKGALYEQSQVRPGEEHSLGGPGDEETQVILVSSLALQPSATPAKPNTIKKIAFGTSFWMGYKYWSNVFKRFDDGACPVSSCTISYDKNDADAADALIFNGCNLRRNFTTPIRKNPNQVWVLFSIESPATLDTCTTNSWRDYVGFNWTMTYWRGSEVFMPYGAFIPRDPTEPPPPPRNRWREKQLHYQELKNASSPRGDVMVSVLSSNCPTLSKREDYIDELKKYIAVDVYGDCGPLNCNRRETVINLANEKKPDVVDMCSNVIGSYYFYFGMENSLCRDYGSEKLYRPMSLDVIVVTFGLANYSELAPPNSVINALDFPSPKDLAAYLEKVAASEELYNSFFEWKSKYTVDIGHPFSTMVCNLCAKLHGLDKTYESEKFRPADDVSRSLKNQRIADDSFEIASPETRQSNTLERFRDAGHCLQWTLEGLKPFNGV